MDWRPVNGYEGIYEVNRLGQIRNAKRKNIMAQRINKIGYPYVCLNKNNKQTGKVVHRILAIAFLPNPLNLPTVNHIDGNKQNNDLSNLEWVSYSENNKHAYAHGLKKGITGKVRIAAKPIVAYKDGIFLKEFDCASDATSLGISTSTIFRCLNKKRKSRKGYEFKYKEENK
jgi:hypothetical protein